MWLFLLAALHRMQALSALACSVGCGFVAFASLKIALFIQPLKKGTTHFFAFGSFPFNFVEPVYTRFVRKQASTPRLLAAFRFDISAFSLK